jgi:hypothetical protein
MNPVYYAWHLMRNVRCTAWDIALLSGREKHSGEPLKALFCGQLDPPEMSIRKLYRGGEREEKVLNAQFLSSLMFAGFETSYVARNVGPLALKRKVEQLAADADIVAVDAELFVSRRFEADRYLSVPQWVPQTLIMGDDFEQTQALFRKNTRKELKKVKNRGFEYRISPDLEGIRTFYDEMYVPHVHEIFKEDAALHAWESFERWWKRGAFLLTVSHDESDILAIFMLPHGDKLVSVCNGFRQGIDDGLVKGAVTASDYFSIRYAQEQGFREFDFVASRGMLDDGPFRYKRKWGTSVDTDDHPFNNFKIGIRESTAATVSFLANNPMLVHQDDQRIGKVLLTDPVVSASDVANTISLYWTAGMHCLKIFALHEFAADADQMIESRSEPVELIPLSGIANDVTAYARL